MNLFATKIFLTMFGNGDAALYHDFYFALQNKYPQGAQYGVSRM